jgi:hypothetical protein
LFPDGTASWSRIPTFGIEMLNFHFQGWSRSVVAAWVRSTKFQILRKFLIPLVIRMNLLSAQLVP